MMGTLVREDDCRICPEKDKGAFNTGRKGLNWRKGKGSTRPLIKSVLSSGCKKSWLTSRLKKARKAIWPKPDNSAAQSKKTADQSQKTADQGQKIADQSHKS
jgi:hypothetical protein